MRCTACADASTVTDPAQLNAEGVALLTRQVTQQANVLAYNDVFLIIAGVAGLGCAWVTAVHLRPRLKARRQAKREARNTPTPTRQQTRASYWRR